MPCHVTLIAGDEDRRCYMTQEKLTILIEKYLDESISLAERNQLAALLEKPEHADYFKSVLSSELVNRTHELEPDERIGKAIREHVQERMHDNVPHIPFLHRWRLIAAAILLLAIGSGLYYFNHQSYKSDKSSPITVQTNDAAPGSNKAIWTLADGKQIELDAAVLDMTQERLADVGYNELRTPRGGQYQLILPDGSSVWLNAESSIKYPVVFNDKERRVEVTGEAYFEIEKYANKPFKVLGGGQEIEVLGTSFNINVYDDEPIKKTTLLTGKIRVSVGMPLVGAQNPADDATKATTRVAPTNILQPNEQLQIAGPYSIKKINLENSADIIAWKNGYFSFENLGLKEMAKQIERWYNISIVFEGTFSNLEFGGKMDRTVKLSDLIRFFNDYGFETTLQNRTLIIKHKT